MEIKKIKSVDISTKNLIAAGETRNLVINGDIGAIFTVNIIKLDGTNKESYYDFNARSFTQEFTSKNNLNVTLANNSFLIPILFPADANGETYKILTIASEKDNTEFTNGQHILVKDIVQVGNSTVAVGIDTGSIPGDTTLASKYTSESVSAEFRSTGSTVSTKVVNLPVSITLQNVNDDTHGFGFRLPPMISGGDVTSGNIESVVNYNIPNTHFYSAVSQTVNGSISNKQKVVLNSVANLVVGMEVGYFSSGTVTRLVASEAPVITAINGNQVTLSVAQSISDGVDVQFRAYGMQQIKSAFGYSPEISGFVATGKSFRTNVRTSTELPASTGEITIPLSGTRGISVGARFFGLNVNSNNNNNVIQTVTPSATEGAVTLEFTGGSDNIDALTVTAGTELEIRGSTPTIAITGNVIINKFPNANTKILLDLKKFITHGAAS